MKHRIALPLKIGACVGFLMSAAVLSYGYLEPHINLPPINDLVIFLACPPSILLMAADRGKWYLFVFADSVVILTNTLWYAALTTLVAKILSKR